MENKKEKEREREQVLRHFLDFGVSFGQFLLSHSIKAGTRRIDGSEKSNVSDVTITEKGAPNFCAKDRIKRVSLDLKRPVLHSTGNTTSCT